MSRDDYYVIVYKLLSYLYNCLKKGSPVNIDSLRFAIKADINDKYWDYIIKHLYIEEYVEGVNISKFVGYIGEDCIKINKDFMITPIGIDFLNNDPNMEKAEEFLKVLI